MQVTSALPSIRYSPTALEQLFENLVGNAVRHMGAPTTGGRRVELAATPLVPRWHVTVSDNGVGVSSDMQQRMFDLFQRGTDDLESSGVELAIVREIVRRYGVR